MSPCAQPQPARTREPRNKRDRERQPRYRFRKYLHAKQHTRNLHAWASDLSTCTQTRSPSQRGILHDVPLTRRAEVPIYPDGYGRWLGQVGVRRACGDEALWPQYGNLNDSLLFGGGKVTEVGYLSRMRGEVDELRRAEEKGEVQRPASAAGAAGEVEMGEWDSDETVSKDGSEEDGGEGEEEGDGDGQTRMSDVEEQVRRDLEMIAERKRVEREERRKERYAVEAVREP